MLLLVEDNEYISKGLLYALKQNNYQVLLAKNIKEAIKIINENVIDLCILDIMLPDGNGFDFYKNYLPKTKTIFLTAILDEEKLVDAFEAGADDYLTKPFKMKELLARIKKQLNDINLDKRIKVRDVLLDLDKMVAYKKGKPINLTYVELNILTMFFTNKKNIITRDMLINRIYELTGNDVYDNTITVYLKRLRNKIGDDIIVTVKGIGYKVNDEEW